MIFLFLYKDIYRYYHYYHRNIF